MTLKPNDNHRDRFSAGGFEPARGLGQRDVAHHPLAKEAKEIEADTEHQDRVGKSHHHAGKSEARDHDRGDLPSGPEIHDPADKRQGRGASERRKAIEIAPLAVAHPKGFAQLPAARTNKNRLPEP